MKVIVLVMMAVVVATATAKTIHRSFCNGYPVVSGVETRTPSNVGSGSTALKPPKVVQRKTIVVTNRVTITKQQAEKKLKEKKK